MNKPEFSDSWPDSWKICYRYDREEVFDQISKYGYAYAYQSRRQAALSMIQRFVPSGSHLLDVAAAQGNFSLALAEQGYRVTWNDLRQELQEYVELKYETGEIHYAPGNAFELDFPQLFDAVLIAEVIEHVAHPDQFLAKVATLVKPGGHVIMTTPNGDYFKNILPRFSECQNPEIYEQRQFGPDSDDHIFLICPHEIEGLARGAQLTVNKMFTVTNSLTNGHMKSELLLRCFPRGLVFLLEKLTRSWLPFIRNKINTNLVVVFQKNQ